LEIFIATMSGRSRSRKQADSGGISECRSSNSSRGSSSHSSQNPKQNKNKKQILAPPPPPPPTTTTTTTTSEGKKNRRQIHITQVLGVAVTLSKNTSSVQVYVYE
jgi:hypothetical protein